jgi:GNAT superfamily N-acetyltransferase
MTQARRATQPDLPAVVGVLSEAFFADRIFRWIVPDDEQRRRCGHLFYEVLVEAFWRDGEIWVAGAGKGAALWLPPGGSLVPPADAETLAARLLATTGGAESTARMAELFAALDAHHPTEPCWYLNFMGIDPAAQGQGLGSALLASALGQADQEGMPAYLEASSPQNRKLYERHGYETMGELIVSDSPALYQMWRLPVG